MIKHIRRRTWSAWLCALIFGLCVPCAAAVQGGGSERMAWEEFLAAYEAACREGGTVRLTGNLTVPDDFRFAPTERPVVIEAGRYAISTAYGAALTFANPRLTIRGKGADLATLIPLGPLALEALTMEVEDCSALLVPKCEWFDMSRASRVVVRSRCTEAFAANAPFASLSIYAGVLRLRNLTIEAQGCETGVDVACDMQVENCAITVTGDRAQEAIRTLPSCTVDWDDASCLEPPIGGLPAAHRYEVTYLENGEPLQVFSGLTREELPLPQTLRASLQNPEVVEDSRTGVPIAVDWDLSTLPEWLTAGEYQVTATLREDALAALDAVNPEEHTAVCRIWVLDPGPLTTLEVTAIFRENGPIGLRLWMPKLEGATAVHVEYSANGTQWTRLRDDQTGLDNLLEIFEDHPYDEPEGWQFAMTLEEKLTQFYVRVLVEGSPFAGISNTVRLESASENTTASDDIGGDRGGAQNKPTRQPASSAPFGNARTTETIVPSSTADRDVTTAVGTTVSAHGTEAGAAGAETGGPSCVPAAALAAVSALMLAAMIFPKTVRKDG